jgi:hypothetical protein
MNKKSQYRVQWNQPYTHWTPTKPTNTDPLTDPLQDQKSFPEARALLDRIRQKR